jgi:hypothetical protein
MDSITKASTGSRTITRCVDSATCDAFDNDFVMR